MQRNPPTSGAAWAQMLSELPNVPWSLDTACLLSKLADRQKAVAFQQKQNALSNAAMHLYLTRAMSASV